ncbi:hypothetical protein CCAX7_18650 [Capsulimonas corticalis]|uniref:Uncharacterized protein n=1 Tax=Capsulimonas corticalis TaxID=2219043 RepID=A0A402D5R2_9BACT|nr:DUF692 family multinuclear iron-containing protein [Capsulimonas corticalis]BDI29814.1 hypothetical protein CCAX7_18650 [Capsulimonas corticalis]
MMKLAINYSSAADGLARDGLLPVDLFKCPSPFDTDVSVHMPDLLERARGTRPVYVHFPLFAGNGSLRDVDWDGIESVLAETATPYVNLHLETRSADFPGVPVDTTDPAHQEQIAEALIADVALAVARLGAERVIVENVVARGSVLRPCIEPGVIARVVEETRCGLLLDTAHVRLTAEELGFDARAYIAALPLRQLRELHVTGAQPHEGGRLRDSMPMGAQDWDLLEYVLAKIQGGRAAEPWCMALEYGGVGPGFDWRSDPQIIAEQTSRLRRFVKT